MPLYEFERSPLKFLPLCAVGPLHQGGRVVLEEKKGSTIVEAEAINTDTVEITVNEPRTLVYGDALESSRFFGELLDPKEIDITKVPTTIQFVGKSVVVKGDKDEMTEEGTFPLNRAHILWTAHRRLET